MLKIAPPDNFFYEAALKVPYAIAAIGIDSKFLWVNDAFCKLVGHADVELKTLSWMDITYHDDIGSSILEINKVLNNETDYYTLTKKIYRKNGDLIDVELLVYRYPPNGDVLMLLVYVDNLMTTDLYIKKIVLEIAEMKLKNEHYIKELENPNRIFQLIWAGLKANWGAITTICGIVAATCGWIVTLIVKEMLK